MIGEVEDSLWRLEDASSDSDLREVEKPKKKRKTPVKATPKKGKKEVKKKTPKKTKTSKKKTQKKKMEKESGDEGDGSDDEDEGDSDSRSEPESESEDEAESSKALSSDAILIEKYRWTGGSRVSFVIYLIYVYSGDGRG